MPPTEEEQRLEWFLAAMAERAPSVVRQARALPRQRLALIWQDIALIETPRLRYSAFIGQVQAAWRKAMKAAVYEVITAEPPAPPPIDTTTQEVTPW